MKSGYYEIKKRRVWHDIFNHTHLAYRAILLFFRFMMRGGFQCRCPYRGGYRCWCWCWCYQWCYRHCRCPYRGGYRCWCYQWCCRHCCCGYRCWCWCWCCRHYCYYCWHHRRSMQLLHHRCILLRHLRTVRHDCHCLGSIVLRHLGIVIYNHCCCCHSVCSCHHSFCRCCHSALQMQGLLSERVWLRRMHIPLRWLHSLPGSGF